MPLPLAPPPPSGRLGLVYECVGGTHAPKILKVERGTPAESAGLFAGDRILSVGDTPVAGIDSRQLTELLQFSSKHGHVVLQVARSQGHQGHGMNIFTTVMALDKPKQAPHTSPRSRSNITINNTTTRYMSPPRLPASQREPRWKGQPDYLRVQLADGSKRDRDLFESGANLVDSLWAPTKVRTPPGAGVRELPPPKDREPPQLPVAPARHQSPRKSKDSWGTWDPFSAASELVLPISNQPQGGQQRPPADVDHTRQQRVRPHSPAKGLWDPAGQVRASGGTSPHHQVNGGVKAAVRHSNPEVTGLWAPAGQVRKGGGRHADGALPTGARGPVKEMDSDWYVVQQTASQPYPSSRKIRANDTAAKFTPDGCIDVVVLQATNLPMASTFGLADAYCTTSLGTPSVSTRVVGNQLNPVFNTILRFAMCKPQTITVLVMNKTLLGDSEIGRVALSWEDVQQGTTKDFDLHTGSGKRVTDSTGVASSLRTYAIIGPGRVGGLVNMTSQSAHDMPHVNVAADSNARTPRAHLSGAEGVTLTIDQDYQSAKNRESAWSQEFSRDVCGALRCNPARFEYVGMRSGSILVTFNILPTNGLDGDNRTARNLASELTLQVYDPNSPLKQSHNAANAVKVMLHAPQKPRGIPFAIEAPFQSSMQPAAFATRQVDRRQVVFGTNAYSAILEQMIEPANNGHTPGAMSNNVSRQGGGVKQAAEGAQIGSGARPAFGSEAIVPVFDKMLEPIIGVPTKDTPVVESRKPVVTAPAPAPAVPEKGASERPGKIAAIRMRLDLPMERCGPEGSAQREQFKQHVTRDLSSAAGMPETCFNIVALSAGSVIVDTEIHSYPQMAAGGRDALAVALDLQRQARYFVVMLGAVTCSSDTSLCAHQPTATHKTSHARFNLGFSHRETLCVADTCVKCKYEQHPKLTAEGWRADTIL